jgi:hypothetical protein
MWAVEVYATPLVGALTWNGFRYVRGRGLGKPLPVSINVSVSRILGIMFNLSFYSEYSKYVKLSVYLMIK